MDKRLNLHSLADQILSWGNRIILNIPLPAGCIFALRGRLSPYFSRVLSGLRKNLSCSVSGNFRRNIHRIEKGLVHLNPKSLFALGYIKETVELFSEFADQYAAGEEEDIETLIWAKDVLKEYFATVSPCKKIDSAKMAYECVCQNLKIQGKSTSPWGSTPYENKVRPPVPISFDQMRQLAIRRRSIRHYQEKPVPLELLQKAVDIARFAPSACNRQPFHFHFFSDPEKIAQLVQIPGGMRDFDRLDKIPCVGILTVDYSNYFHERDLLAPVIDAGLAAMSFQFALETLGLSSVCVNWPILPNRYRRLEKIVSLKKSETPVLFFAIGYPASDALIPASCKKSVDSLMSYDGEIEP